MNINFKIYIFYSVKILSCVFMVFISSFLNVLLKKIIVQFIWVFQGERNHTDGVEVSKPQKDLILQLYFMYSMLSYVYASCYVKITKL